MAAQENLVKNILSNYLDHFCRRDDEWLDGEVLDVSCHEVGVFLGKSNFVEHNILGIREVDARIIFAGLDSRLFEMTADTMTFVSITA